MSRKFLKINLCLMLALAVFASGLWAKDVRDANPLVTRMDSEKIIAEAETGDAQAQFDLAILYGRGVGVQINHNLAWEWIEKAAKNGHAEAQYWLAYGFFYGNNTALDRAKAFSWYKRSAESGNTNAQFMVAYLLDTGKYQEIPRKPKEAIRWYSTAGNGGHAEAAFRLGCKSYFGVDVAKTRLLHSAGLKLRERTAILSPADI